MNKQDEIGSEEFKCEEEWYDHDFISLHLLRKNRLNETNKKQNFED